jgi:hypothetical protein
MMLQLDSALISILLAAANCISWSAELTKMGILHRPASCSRRSVRLGTVFVLAFTAVHAEVSPPTEVDVDFDVIVAGAPGTHHAGPLMVLLYFNVCSVAENKHWLVFTRNLVQRRFDYGSVSR